MALFPNTAQPSLVTICLCQFATVTIANKYQFASHFRHFALAHATDDPNMRNLRSSLKSSWCACVVIQRSTNWTINHIHYIGVFTDSWNDTWNFKNHTRSTIVRFIRSVIPFCRAVYSFVRWCSIPDLLHKISKISLQNSVPWSQLFACRPIPWIVQNGSVDRLKRQLCLPDSVAVKQFYS